MGLEIHKGSKGYFVQYPTDFKREDVSPPACGWFKRRADAEAEALRLAEATGKGFLIVRVVSKCIPWHCHDKTPNTQVTGAAPTNGERSNEV